MSDGELIAISLIIGCFVTAGVAALCYLKDRIDSLSRELTALREHVDLGS